MTAVEFLVVELEADDSKIARIIGLKKYNSIIQQAKKMEKQQIFEAHHRGYKDGECFSAEEYYNEKFKIKDNDRATDTIEN